MQAGGLSLCKSLARVKSPRYVLSMARLAPLVTKVFTYSGLIMILDAKRLTMDKKRQELQAAPPSSSFSFSSSSPSGRKMTSGQTLSAFANNTNNATQRHRGLGYLSMAVSNQIEGGATGNSAPPQVLPPHTPKLLTVLGKGHLHHATRQTPLKRQRSAVDVIADAQTKPLILSPRRQLLIEDPDFRHGHPYMATDPHIRPRNQFPARPSLIRRAKRYVCPNTTPRCWQGPDKQGQDNERGMVVGSSRFSCVCSTAASASRREQWSAVPSRGGMPETGTAQKPLPSKCEGHRSAPARELSAEIEVPEHKARRTESATAPLICPRCKKPRRSKTEIKKLQETSMYTSLLTSSPADFTGAPSTGRKVTESASSPDTSDHECHFSSRPPPPRASSKFFKPFPQRPPPSMAFLSQPAPNDLRGLQRKLPSSPKVKNRPSSAFWASSSSSGQDTLSALIGRLVRRKEQEIWQAMEKSQSSRCRSAGSGARAGQKAEPVTQWLSLCRSWSRPDYSIKRL